MNKFYTILAFSNPKIKNNQYNVIASSHCLSRPSPIDWRSEKMFEGLNFIFTKNLRIIIIHNSNERYSDLQVFDVRGSNYDVFNISVKLFFDYSYIQEGFLKQRYNSQTIYMFENLEYKAIVTCFATHNIIISGGSNSKKHIISPVQLRLARFLIAITPYTEEIVGESFHNKESGINSGVDFTSPKVKGMISQMNDDQKKEFIEYAKTLNSVRVEKTDNYSIFNHPSQKRSYHSTTIKNNNNYSLVTSTPSPISISKEDYINNPISSFINYVKEIINNVNLNDREAQLKIENIWIDLIKTNLKNDNYLLKNHSNKLHYLLFESYKTLNLLVENNIVKKKFPDLYIYTNLYKIEFILLTFVCCFTYSDRLSYTALSHLIGDNIIYNLFKLSNMESYNDFKESINYYKNNKELPIYLGDFFISILTQFPHDLFERKFSPSSFFTKESVILKINSTYLDEIRRNLIINPYNLPMLTQPNNWSDSSFGGYLENSTKQVDIITGSDHHKHIIEDKEPLYNAINTLNSIKFGINNLLLDYLNNEGKYLLDQIPGENDIQKNMTLEIASLLKQRHFYLSVNADWRSRIYTQSFFISYQGGDLSSALLNFWEGQSLTESGKYMLYIHGANVHNENNISKDSFENRVQWVLNNIDKIINLDKELILSAEKPFTFVAFCLNMRELHNNPDVIIKTPVFLDATCSGIQHLAALLEDLELGIHVNITEYEKYDKPNDIYSHLLYFINKAINEYGINNPQYFKLSLIELRRSDVKESIMTKVYNVSNYGIAKQLEAKFKSIDLNQYRLDAINDTLITSLKNNDRNKKLFLAPGKNNTKVNLNKEEIFKIANLINDQIFVVFPSLNNIYSYFLDVSKLIIKLGIPLTWITPVGLKITQHYLKSKQRVISTKLFNITKKIVLKEYLDKIDNTKQINAIIPNIIHSLDASHLISLINSSAQQKFGPIITIHDCFGTHPNLMEELAFKVKKEFILIYTKENFLKAFHDRMLNTIKEHNYDIILNTLDNHQYVVTLDDKDYLKIPNLPTLGKLDLQRIIDSKYLIS